MIETSRVGRRALLASALGGFGWLGLCGFGGGTAPAPLAAGGGGGAPALELEWSVSPDGEWLAVSASRGRKDAFDAWLVAVGDGAARELDEVGRAAPQLCFDSLGRLRIYTIDAARGAPAILWTDPRTGEVLESTRDRTRIRAELEPLERGWARIETRRVGERLTPRRIEWTAKRTHFDFDPKRDVELAISDAPGIAYYTRRVGDQLKLMRRDLGNGTESTLVVEGRGLLGWRLSDDGRAVALHERGIDSRVRVIDANTGALIAGPWLGDGVEWAPGGGSRRLLISVGDTRRLVDILSDSTLVAGDWRQFQVLGDGAVIAQTDRQIVLLDRELQEVRVLFESPDLAAQATR